MCGLHVGRSVLGRTQPLMAHNGADANRTERGVRAQQARAVIYGYVRCTVPFYSLPPFPTRGFRMAGP